MSAEKFFAAIDATGHRGAPDGTRRLPRANLRGSIAIAASGGDPSAVTVRMRDVSRGGMRFAHHKPMPRGTELVAKLPRSDSDAMALPCCVMHCRAIGPDHFAIGVQFVQSGDTAKIPVLFS